MDGTPLVGVALRRWFHHRPTLIPHKYAVKYHLRPVPGRKPYATLVSLLAQTLDRLAAQHGAHIVFLPTYTVEHEADDQACEDVARTMASPSRTIVDVPDPSLYKAITGLLSVMLGARMHATIFAAAMGTPVVGLSSNPKFQGFFDLIGCGNSVLEIEDFVARGMTERLAALVSHAITGDQTARPQLDGLTEHTRQYTAELLN
jgi:polysaccharide pyruvyl transferase WcaK-like protein